MALEHSVFRPEVSGRVGIARYELAAEFRRSRLINVTDNFSSGYTKFTYYVAMCKSKPEQTRAPLDKYVHSM